MSDSERVDIREEGAGIQDRALKTGMSPFSTFKLSGVVTTRHGMGHFEFRKPVRQRIRDSVA